MKNVMGLIYTGENDGLLRELTTLRAIAALPVAGRYRMIDFMLSSMVNSGVHNVGIIMQKNYHSLMDHVGSGKEWDLHGKHEGLHILPPFLTRDNVGVYAGSLDALKANMNFLERSNQEYVLLTNSLILYNANFREMFQAYQDSGCDVMALYTRDESMRGGENCTYLNVAEDGRVTDIEIDPTYPRYSCVNMDAFIIRKDLLINLVDRNTAHGYHGLMKDVFQRMVRDAGLRMYGFEFKDVCFRADSVQNYYALNMRILDPQVRHMLFHEDKPVFTKVRDEMPTRYVDGSAAVNALVADGCVIEGQVDHSVLFRGVQIDKGAFVKNCILMQDAHIEAGAHIENCILDKQATIKAGGTLIGPSSYPIVISKNMTI